jgi:GTP-binding protein
MPYNGVVIAIVFLGVLWITVSLLPKVQGSFLQIEPQRQPPGSLIGITISNQHRRVSLSSKTHSTESNDTVATTSSSESGFTTFKKNDRSLPYSFFDEAFITVRAGSGGQGSNSYTVRRTSPRGGKNSINKQSKQQQQQQQRGKPDGGNGGRGGHVILCVDKNLNTLAGLANHPSLSSSSSSSSIPFFRAEHGQEGRSRFQNGRSGNDVMIRVPPGTIVQEERVILDAVGNVSTVEWIDVGTLALLSSNDDENEPVGPTTKETTTSTLIVAHGGAGGEGTGVWANGMPSVPRRSPVAGERKNLKLTLKLIADVAVIGVPNAGKSTFLAAATRAKPKIANYPFSTIIPNLGVAWIPPANFHKDDHTDDNSFERKPLVLCDVPGLVAGAAQGVGLGHAFLRHVERCHVLLHVIDATAEDPLADYRMLNLELVEYGSGQLATVPQIVVVNKADALMSSEDQRERQQPEQQTIPRNREDLEEELRRVMPHSRLLWMSAKNRQGVDDLLLRLAAFVEKVKTATAAQEQQQQQQQQQN